MASDRERARRARAELRRRQIVYGEKVGAGIPKPGLYDDRTPIGRLEALYRLSIRQGTTSRPRPERRPRAERPGELFDIEAERARTE